MIRPLAAALCLTLTLAAPARAAETLLRVSETANVMATPDELAATLRAEGVATTAAEAQGQVNALIRDALARAKAEPGVTVSTGGYQVWRAPATPGRSGDRWQAGQSLTLTSHDGVKLLTLVGTLQQKGLATSGLAWRLSRDAERGAHQEALRKAIAALRGRVEEAAGLLELRFDHFREVRLDQPRIAPVPMFRAAMAMAAPQDATPSAAAEEVPVSATADADAVLVPR